MSNEHCPNVKNNSKCNAETTPHTNDIFTNRASNHESVENKRISDLCITLSVAIKYRI